MIDVMAQLVRNNYTLTLISVLYILSCFFVKCYAPKDFYNMGKLILLGFLVPLRPVILISFHEKKVLGEAFTNISALQHSFSELVEEAGQKKINAAFAEDAIFSLEQIIFVVWAFGAVSMVLYCFIKHMLFLKVTKRWSSDVTDPKILIAITELKKKLGINSDLQVRYCACISSPMLMQSVNPVILLSENIYTEQELRLVLHHEMIHYKRNDLLYKLMLMFAVAVNWFNPIIYLFSKVFTYYGEISCDEIVTENMDEIGRDQYIRTIIDMAAKKSIFNTIFSSSFYGGKEGMKKRIYSIMNISKKRLGHGIFAVCLSLILCSGTVFAAAPNAEEIRNDRDIQQVKIITEEDIVKEIEKSFSEVYSNEFNEKDFPGMIITYDENGIPIVSDPNNISQKRAVYASVKAYKGGFYSSSDCSSDSLVFYILKGYQVEVLDSASYTDVVKVSYAGSTGYMKKSELKF